MPAPSNRGKFLLLTLIFALVIIAAFVAYNAVYLFHTELHEAGDPAANTLSVIRASHFQQIYGTYSRWRFHHPGPAMFYYYAAMEAIFYRGLHVVPTPFNAQLLGNMALTLSCLATGIGVAARWTQSRYFMPLAFLLATLHFTAVDLRFVVASTWPACVLPLIFFCLLVTAASVAAGQGDDLPLLVTAGCFAIHSHVAQPLFVLPMFLVGYLGLSWACYQAARGAGGGEERRRLAPWRLFPRSHLLAGMLACVFLLPLLLDLCKGAQSNLALILAHLRSPRGPAPSWRDSLFYFVHFGTYKVSIFNGALPPGTMPGETGHYLATHPEMTLLWCGALLSPLLAGVAHRFRRVPAAAETTAAGVVPTGDVDARPARWRFLAALGLVWIISVGLTLVWGHIQEGEMFYYNAWFNHSIYFTLALLAAVALSDTLESLSSRSPRWGGRAAVAFGVLCFMAGWLECWRHPEQLRDVECTGPAEVAQARTVNAALRDRPGTPRTKLLLFPNPAAWPAATGIAVLLERAGDALRVLADWKIMFGDDLALSLPQLEELGLPERERLDIWRLLPAADHPELAARYPLVAGFALQPGGVGIDPARDEAISFVGQRPNLDAYVLYGWGQPEGPGSAFTLSLGKAAVLNFHAVPVPAGASVEMSLDAVPLFPGITATQSLGVYWNGTGLGTFQVSAETPVRVSIPAALWNAQPEVLLRLSFPDAMTPHEINKDSSDTRQLAFAWRKITFQTVNPSVSR